MRKYMKWLTICWMFILLGGSVTAFAEDDTIKMVTYFPVPYAAYNAVFSSDKFDIGTSKGSFTLNIGNQDCKDNTNNVKSSLTTGATGDVTLKAVVNNVSALSFGTDMYTPTATFGTSAPSQGSTLTFEQNLRVDNINTSIPNFPVKSLTGDTVAVYGPMHMIKDAFTSSSSSSVLPSCNGVVSWQSLQLGNDEQEHYFLTCGTGEACQDKEADVSACQNTAGNSAYVQGTWIYSPTCECSCPVANSERTADGHCQCKDGYTRTNNNTCVAEEEQCEHGTRPDGSCKELTLKWGIQAVQEVAPPIPACAVNSTNNVWNPTTQDYTNMDYENCYSACPDGSTFAFEIPGQESCFGKQCNAETGSFNCILSTHTEIHSYADRDMNFCIFVIGACAQWPIYE